MSLLFVSVGTDHHPFVRLLTWVERFSATHPDVHVVVQHGYSPAPRLVEAHEMLAASPLIELLEKADAVVTHGGPGTILEARGAGHTPVVVPRERRFGEHVDDHQVRFVTRLAGSGMVDMALDEPQFERAVEAALLRGRQDVEEDTDVTAAVARFAGLVDTLVHGEVAPGVASSERTRRVRT